MFTSIVFDLELHEQKALIQMKATEKFFLIMTSSNLQFVNKP